MKIAVIGATGKAGQKIVEEAVQRGHDVTAIVRSASKVTANIDVIEKEVFDSETDSTDDSDEVIESPGKKLIVSKIKKIFKKSPSLI